MADPAGALHVEARVEAPPAGGRGRTGRRRGKPDTRGQILDVALAAFQRSGYEDTSSRGVAREAGVDPALVHRYFGSKKDLLLAAVQMGFDPTKVIDAMAAEGTEHLGSRVVYVVTGVWEQRLGPNWIASVRANPGVVKVMIGFFNPLIAAAMQRVMHVSAEEARLRASFAELVMSGLAMTRYVANLEPLAELSREEIADVLGPVIDHLMTCELPTGKARRG